MNDEARRHMEHALSSLEDAKSCLTKAHKNAENGTVRSRIETEIGHIEGCLRDCQGITSGMAQQ